MSELCELVRDLCPDGVEYRTLGEIATDIFRGNGIKRDEVTENGTPCVRYGEIYTTYGIWFDSCVSHTDESTIKNKRYFEHGDILFAITGENVEEIAKSCAYVGHEKCLAGGDIVVLKHNQNPKYLSYALATTDAQRQKSKGKVKSKVVHSGVPAISELVVPVPPLAVQEKIVEILDAFTDLTAELAAELTARKKQYAYYRDRLLDFGTPERPKDGVEFRTLGEITVIKIGSKPQCIYDIQGEFDYINAGTTKSGYTDKCNCVGDTVTTPSRGQGGIGYANYQKREFWLGPLCYGIKSNTENILTKYLFYWMTNNRDKILALKNEGGTPSLNLRDLITLEIPLPPLSEQRRIVDILDRFDALCTDLTDGLPAEIAARKKQYEHYRDRLLTFAPLSRG